MPPRNANRIKTLAAMFASLSLFAATRAHAATHVIPAGTIPDRAANDTFDRVRKVERFG